MSLSMVFGRDDPARTRFVVSPLFETMAALRVLLEPGGSSTTCPGWKPCGPRWSSSTCGHCSTLSPRHGWTPDFLNPAPAGPGTDVAWQLAQVRATPHGAGRARDRRSLTQRLGDPVPPGAWQLLDDPAVEPGPGSRTSWSNAGGC